VSRSLYPFALCLTLVLLATMWLRPGLAQELIEMAGRIRLQSPDPLRSSSTAATGSTPPADPFLQVPYDSVARPPMNPVPVTRPVNWPGTSTQPAVSPAPQMPAAANPPAGGGVQVWDPNAGRYAAPPNSAPQYAPQAPQYVAQAPQYVAQAPQPSSPPLQAPYVPPTGMSSLGPSASMPPPAANISPPASNAFPPPAAGMPPVANTLPPGANVLPPAGNGSLVQPPQQAPPAAPPAGQQFPPSPNFNAPNMQVWLTDATTAGRIGNQVVLIGDLYALFADTVFRNNVEIPPEQRELAFKQAQRPLLKQSIEQKLVYNDALKTIPKEALPKVEEQINEGFKKEMLPRLFKANEVSNVQELDKKMRERGSSLDFMRRTFLEQSIYGEWIRTKTKSKEDIPPSELIGYYRTHLTEYDIIAKARWEELMVEYHRFPNKAAAKSAIAQMGNAVQSGRPLAEVAKVGSHGLTAAEGGQWDWTTKDSLSTKEIDRAIFGLPVGQLSQIIETERGFHIVRVVERQDAGRKEFIDVQSDIRKQLKEAKEKKLRDDYISQLRATTPIWTMFDNEPGGIEGPQQLRRSILE
jgi:parvulin-like peptidyl-prolyl isomerase